MTPWGGVLEDGSRLTGWVGFLRVTSSPAGSPGLGQSRGSVLAHADTGHTGREGGVVGRDSGKLGQDQVWGLSG